MRVNKQEFIKIRKYLRAPHSLDRPIRRFKLLIRHIHNKNKAIVITTLIIQLQFPFLYIIFANNTAERSS